MRATEVLRESQLLFEMPYLMAGSVDWGLNDPRRNRRRAGVIRHSNPTVVSHDQFSTLYRRAITGGGEFARIVSKDGLIVYFMRYQTAQHAVLGRCATQIQVWQTISPGGPPSTAAHVFFDIMLAEFDSMVSDRMQTDDGRGFWLRRMAQAITRGMRVGLLDHGTPIDYDPQIGWNAWLTRVDGWGKLPEHHERLFYISTTKPDA